MRRLTQVLVILAVALLCVAGALAEWLSTIETTFTGTTWTWWQTDAPMVHVQSIFANQASGTNTVTFWAVDANTNLYLLETTANSADHPIFSSAWVTPGGNGVIDVPRGSGIRIVRTRTNELMRVKMALGDGR